MLEPTDLAMLSKKIKYWWIENITIINLVPNCITMHDCPFLAFHVTNPTYSHLAMFHKGFCDKECFET